MMKGVQLRRATTLKPGSDEEATVKATPFLPMLVVVWDILVRLPAKALLRCRAHQPSLPLLSFGGEIDACRRNVDAALDAFDFRRRPAERRPLLRFSDYSHRGPSLMVPSTSATRPRASGPHTTSGGATFKPAMTSVKKIDDIGSPTPTARRLALLPINRRFVFQFPIGVFSVLARTAMTPHRGNRQLLRSCLLQPRP
ncbi:hypothetical protein GQ55_1G107100 [Panicum hallii var. hallii]|uniref:Uncharacterized protein n=1 Tax=Panicum hallii var. hallii TaxID=1504633 RepID=A0A2T7F4D5_9POAL|nr:hypothetical protein GQ55_1G107100 [Panicum hallii var. hallii]